MMSVEMSVMLACVGVLTVAAGNDGRGGGRREVQDSSELSCSVVDERAETIIQTKQSLAAGAVFLVAPDIEAQDDCLSACCNTPSCDTAIVMWKDNKFGCYLFSCHSPSVCTFSTHVSYSSFSMVTNIVDTHASDLAQLASAPSLTVMWTSPPVPATQTNIVTEPSSLYGTCRTSDNCAVQQHLECLHGYCVCQPGYHTVASVCRADCHRFQFECVNKAEPSLSECIAVYDRCSGIIQCRDGSDEMDCPPTDHGDSDAAGMQPDELQSSLSSNLSQTGDAKPNSPSQQHVDTADVAQSDVHGQVLNKSHGKGTAAADDSYGGVVVDGKTDTAAGDDAGDMEEHLHRLSGSVPAGRLAHSYSDGNSADRTYKEKEKYSAGQSREQDPVSDTGKSVGRVPETEQRARQKTPGGKVTEVGKVVKDGVRPASSDDTVSQQGNLLLSGMVDNSDEPKHDIGTRPRYPAVETGRNAEVELDRNGGGKMGGEYRKVTRPKPLFGGVEKSSHSVDETDKPVGRYGAADEPRRLRKPDLSRGIDTSSAADHWKPPAKSASYHYGRPDSGPYPNYLKPSSQFPSSSLSSEDSNKHHVKTYGPESAGGIQDDGRIRSGLTEARPRKPADDKNAGPQGSDARSFPLRKGVVHNSVAGQRAQYDSHAGSGFRDAGFSNAKPSYSRGVKAPSSRHSGLVAEQSAYPSNSHDVLYGDAFYPASPDDYYYSDGLAGPAGRSAGYDRQAPVDYNYYNMAPGVERQPLPVKTAKHSRGGQKAVLTTTAASANQAPRVKLTTVEPRSTSPPHRQHFTSTISTTTPHARVLTTSPAALKKSPSLPVHITSSPQPSSSTRDEQQKPPQPHAGRKHVLVSAEVARSEMLWSTAGVKGAVVALTLGIIVTLLTLVYVGCHYRHQRRISRRHRHLPAGGGSHDADYLVNGMYL